MTDYDPTIPWPEIEGWTKSDQYYDKTINPFVEMVYTYDQNPDVVAHFNEEVRDYLIKLHETESFGEFGELEDIHEILANV